LAIAWQVRGDPKHPLHIAGVVYRLWMCQSPRDLGAGDAEVVQSKSGLKARHGRAI